MRTLLLILLPLLPVLIDAAVYRGLPAPPQFAFHPTMTLPVTHTAPLHITVAINAALFANKGLMITTNYELDTETVLSKCGQPIYLIFPARSINDFISAEDVLSLRYAYNYKCNPGDIRRLVDITHQSDIMVSGVTNFTTHERRDGSQRLIKVHNITSPIISSVDFDLPQYQSNMYPIKIGHLLHEATKRNRQLILSVNATSEVYFYFSKCGYTYARFNSTITDSMVIDAKSVRRLQQLQDMKCGKWWMTGIITLELIAGRNGTRGIIQFEVANLQKTDEFAAFVIELVIMSVFGVIVIVVIVFIIVFLLRPKCFC